MARLSSTPPELPLECPVCEEIPDGIVVQCQNGHILCDNCRKIVKKCPTCRVSFGKAKIRNLFAEDYFRSKELACKYKHAGCEEKLKRELMVDHLNACHYQWRVQPLCQLALGDNCKFVVNLLKVPEVIRHFVDDHGFHLANAKKAMIILQNFEHFTRSSPVTWTPTILKYSPNSYFLVTVKFDNSDNTVYFGCNFLNDPCKPVTPTEHYRITFSVQAPSTSTTKNMDWIVYPRALDWAGRVGYLINYPIHKIPVTHLNSEYMIQGRLNIVVDVKKEGKIVNTGQFQTFHLNPIKMKYESHKIIVNWNCYSCERDLEIYTEKFYFCLQCPPNWFLCYECMEKTGKYFHHMYALLQGSNQQRYMIMLGMKLGKNKIHWHANFKQDDAQGDCNFVDQSVRNAAVIECKEFFVEVACDVCSGYPIVKVLYFCLLCPNSKYYCESCVNKGAHSHHILGAIYNSEQENLFKSNRKDGSSFLPLLASEVFLK